MNKLQDVTILRSIAVLSLVMWHSYCPYICWGTAESPLNGFYTKLFTKIIPDANMPLFTFLAGYLFYYLHEEKGKYKNFKDFFINKTHRLLIPYLVLGLVINLMEYDKHVIDFLYGIPNHLWYCLMLFYVYIVCWLSVNKLGKKWNKIIALISLVIVLYYGGGVLSHRMLGGVFLPIYYYVYFYVGYIAFQYRDKLLGNYWISALFVCIYLIAIIYPNRHLLIFQCISYIFILLFISNTVIVKRVSMRIWHWIEKISFYSFGIYVFHQWIIWNITRIPASISFIRPYMENHYIVFPLVFYMTIFMLSMGLTAFSMKSTIGRYFLS